MRKNLQWVPITGVWSGVRYSVKLTGPGFFVTFLILMHLIIVK